MDIPDAVTTVPPRESWATAVARYAVNVLGLLGVGAILTVILGQFWEPRDGGGLLGFALLFAVWWTWMEQHASDRPHQGRQLAVIAVCAVALYVLTLVIGQRAEFTGPALSGTRSLVFGLVAIVGSLLVSARLDAQVDPAPE